MFPSRHPDRSEAPNRHPDRSEAEWRDPFRLSDPIHDSTKKIRRTVVILNEVKNLSRGHEVTNDRMWRQPFQNQSIMASEHPLRRGDPSFLSSLTMPMCRVY